MRTLPRAAFVSLLACALVSGAAWADPAYQPSSGGDYGVYAKFQDWTSLYRAGVPVGIGVFPAPGDEGRSLLYATTFQPNDIPLDTVPNGNIFWVGGPASGEEITGLEYDFIIPGAVPGALHEYQVGTGYVTVGASGVIFRAGSVDTYFIPGPAAGGVIDIYLDTTPDFFPGGPSVAAQGPGAWTGAGAPLGYPGADNTFVGGGVDPAVTVYMTGTFVPLFADLPGGTPLYRDPGEPELAYWDPSGDDIIVAGVIIADPLGDDIACVQSTTGGVPGLVGGRSFAWLDITGGKVIDTGLLNEDHFDLAGTIYDYDLYVESTFTQPGDGWPNTSNDPVLFVVPEPFSFALFGTVLAGAAIYSRKRRS